MIKLLVEALVVGVSTLLVGIVFYWLYGKLFGDKGYRVELTLFVTGVFLHLFFQATLVNRWYCYNGYACN